KMAKTKTTYTTADVSEFINSYTTNDQKKKDSFELIKILQDITGEAPRMWGPTIIGFGNYHYKYNSVHEGDAPVLCISPRKTDFSLYIYLDTEKRKSLILRLWKVNMTKARIYINKPVNNNINVLQELCVKLIKYIAEHFVCSCKAK